MVRWKTWVFGLITATALCGCGTLVNITNKSTENKIYGGTRLDVVGGPYLFGKGVGLIRREEHEKFPPSMCIGLGMCALVDLPFTIIADTLTLPITVRAAIDRAKNAEEEEFHREPESDSQDPTVSLQTTPRQLDTNN